MRRCLFEARRRTGDARAGRIRRRPRRRRILRRGRHVGQRRSREGAGGDDRRAAVGEVARARVEERADTDARPRVARRALAVLELGGIVNVVAVRLVEADAEADSQSDGENGDTTKDCSNHDPASPPPERLPACRFVPFVCRVVAVDAADAAACARLPVRRRGACVAADSAAEGPLPSRQIDHLGIFIHGKRRVRFCRSARKRVLRVARLAGGGCEILGFSAVGVHASGALGAVVAVVRHPCRCAAPCRSVAPLQRAKAPSAEAVRTVRRRSFVERRQRQPVASQENEPWRRRRALRAAQSSP